MNIASNSVSVAIEAITPQMAKAYLATSAGNRALKDAKVASLKRDIVNGSFRLNGESIIFNANGALIDGHHRLTSCVDAGLPIPCVVVRGVEVLAQKTIDTGASRTVGDHLNLDSVKNYTNVSAIINILLSLANGRPRSANPSVTEVYDFISKHPEVHDAASFASSKPYPRLANVLGAIYFVAIKTGETDAARDFKRVFATGIPAYDGCPAHLLRERLNAEAARGRKTSTHEAQRLAFAAWEKFRIGAKVKTLKTPDQYKITGWVQ